MKFHDNCPPPDMKSWLRPWCSNILQWWQNYRLENPSTGDLARNTFCVMVTSVASERSLVNISQPKGQRAYYNIKLTTWMIFGSTLLTGQRSRNPEPAIFRGVGAAFKI